MKSTFVAAFCLVSVGVLFAQTEDQLVPWNLLATPVERSYPNTVLPPGVHALSSGATQSVDEITPEIQALADALGRDPVRVYEWVLNNINYVPVSGVTRGAHLTWLDRAGSTTDQCTLLAALLKACQASAPANIRYRGGILRIPLSRSSPTQTDAVKWLGVPADKMTGTGSPVVVTVSPGGDANSGFVTIRARWVEATFNGSTVAMIPWFKSASWRTAPVDVSALLGTSIATELHTVGAGTDTSPAPTTSAVFSLNTAAVRSKLADKAVVLADALRDDPVLSAFSGQDLVGGGLINVTRLGGSVPPNFAPDVSIDGSPNEDYAWGQLPENVVQWITVLFAGKERTWLMSELRARKLAIWFDSTSSNRAALWLGDEKAVADDGSVMEESLASAQANTPLTLEIRNRNESYETPEQSSGVWPIARGQAVSIFYGASNFAGALQVSLDRQAAYVASGMSSESRELKTENLRVIGLQYASLYDAWAEVITGVGNARYGGYFMAGFITHNLAPGVNVAILRGYAMLKNGLPVDTEENRAINKVATDRLLRGVVYVGSALEYHTIQQAAGASVPAYSTSRVMEIAMQTSPSIEVLLSDTNPSNYATQIGNYISGYATGELAIMQNAKLAGQKLLVPKSGAIPFGGSTIAGWIGGGFRIRGGANGGATPSAATVQSATVAANTASSATAATTVAQNAPKVGTIEPIDLATGAYYYDHVDLTLGSGSAPTGLSLARNYNSRRRNVDPAGLGKGWTHNYAMQVSLRNANDLTVQRASGADLACMLVAARAIIDLHGNDGGRAKHQVLSCIAANWTVDQLLGARVSVTLGERSFEFGALPDGSFRAPAGLTATLTKDPGFYNLTFRHGNTTKFSAATGKFLSITDPYGNHLDATYDASDRLSTVTDAYLRTLTFRYLASGQLYEVADSTGRSVTYGRNASGGFTYGDPETRVTTFPTDASHRVTGIVDARSRTLATNYYDAWDRVVQQLSHGDSNRTWGIGVAPGVGRQTNPEGGTDWVYFDGRGRKVITVDAVGNVTRWTYDGADRVTMVVSPRGAYTKYQYNKDHFMTLETVSGGNGGSAPLAVNERSRRIVPDAQLRPKDVESFETQGGGSAEKRVTTFTYFAQHTVDTVTAPGGLTTKFSYDGRGRVLTSWSPAQSAATIFSNLDSWGNARTATYPDGTEEYYVYNNRGDLLSFTDRSGNQVRHEYNLRRQRTKTIRVLNQ